MKGPCLFFKNCETSKIRAHFNINKKIILSSKMIEVEKLLYQFDIDTFLFIGKLSLKIKISRLLKKLQQSEGTKGII